MPSLLNSLFRSKPEPGPPRTEPLRLVVGLNRVDEIIPDGWDKRLNQPTDEAAEQIRRKCEDAIGKLADDSGIGPTHLEYYAAEKHYRLHFLLNRVVEHCLAGFKLADAQPRHFEDVEGVDPDVRRFARQERARRLQARSGRPSPQDRLFAELGRFLPPEDMRTLMAKITEEKQRPPRIVVLGQTGVGKTTTVNALFGTNWTTDAVGVGTERAQEETVPLPSGGLIQIVDVPGYGRSLPEDARYEAIYERIVPTCDLVLLVLQADRGDFADDLEMIAKLGGWLATPPAPAE
jgi:predicted GTPase